MSDLVYPRERTLGAIMLVIGLLIWIVLVAGTFGIALIFLAVGFLLYLFIQSALIAHIKGNGVELSETQFADLHGQFVACCDRLQMKTRPKAYVLNGNGALNAFATKFLGAQFVVLLSNVVDAMEKHPDGVRFYIGHELGHLRRKHLDNLLRWPAMWLPLLGAAYSRARETTCDRHGRACSASPEGAARALAALSAGAERWKQLDVKTYLDQGKQSSGFWMSFHELTAAYPWLTKRATRVMNTDARMPRRNVFAYLLAAFVPYAGRLGGGFGVLMLVYVVGVLAAIAIPAYHDYVAKAKVVSAVVQSQGARESLARYYESNHKIPESLDAVGVQSKIGADTRLSLGSKGMMLTVGTRYGDLIFTPSINDQGHIVWSCKVGKGLKRSLAPSSCR